MSIYESDVMEGGASRPNFLQNDPKAADYIKNRPFYSETETVKELWETFSLYSSTLDELPAPGQSYVIEFEGKSYKTTTYDTSANGGASMGVGNPNIYDKYAEPGADDADNSTAPEDAYDLPFYGMFVEKFNSSGIYYQFILFTQEDRGFPDEETKITFYQEVEVETIKTLDEKFLPESVKGGESSPFKKIFDGTFTTMQGDGGGAFQTANIVDGTFDMSKMYIVSVDNARADIWFPYLSYNIGYIGEKADDVSEDKPYGFNDFSNKIKIFINEEKTNCPLKIYEVTL